MIGSKKLGGKNLYDDDGALVTGLPFRFENGVFAYNLGGIANLGNPLNMYDDSTVTNFALTQNSAGVSTTGWVKWNLGRKVNFKNIYAYASVSGTGAKTIYLEGSNNDSDWTTIGSRASTGLILGTNIAYKFIRVRGVTGTDINDSISCHYIKGTTR